MSTVMQHSDPATMMSYAAGSLSEPLAAVVAAHLAMCPRCRAEVADMEMIGASLMFRMDCVEPAKAMRVPELAGEAGPKTVERHAVGLGEKLPRTIASAYGLSFDSIPWKRLGPGVWHHRLPLSKGVEGDLRLLKIGPGRVMPDHGHGGSELTLVIEGAYSDVTGVYARGDMQDVDESVEHTPIADRDVGCVCLIASERPARFKSFMGKLIQPWTGM